MTTSPLRLRQRRSITPPNSVSTCLPMTSSSAETIEMSCSSQLSKRVSMSSLRRFSSSSKSPLPTFHSLTSAGIPPSSCKHSARRQLTAHAFSASEPPLDVQRRQASRRRVRLPALQRPPEDLVQLGRRGDIGGGEVEPQRLRGT